MHQPVQICSLNKTRLVPRIFINDKDWRSRRLVMCSTLKTTTGPILNVNSVPLQPWLLSFKVERISSTYWSLFNLLVSRLISRQSDKLYRHRRVRRIIQARFGQTFSTTFSSSTGPFAISRQQIPWSVCGTSYSTVPLNLNRTFLKSRWGNLETSQIFEPHIRMAL